MLVHVLAHMLHLLHAIGCLECPAAGERRNRLAALIKKPPSERLAA